MRPFRSSLVLATMACLAALPAGCETTPSAVPADIAENHAPIESDRVRLSVLGMACPKCVSNVDLQLLKVPGVEAVAINMRDGFVDVDLATAPKPSPAALARAVDDAGLTLTRVEPLAR